MLLPLPGRADRAGAAPPHYPLIPGRCAYSTNPKSSQSSRYCSRLLLPWKRKQQLASHVGESEMKMLVSSGSIVLPCILLAIVYLCVADLLAIDSGTWTINHEYSLGILIGSVLPIEEVVFILFTNILLVFGLIVGVASESINLLRSNLKGLADVRKHRSSKRIAESVERSDLNERTIMKVRLVPYKNTSSSGNYLIYTPSRY